MKALSVITYLIYIVFWEALTLGGCSYIVFGMHRSAYWFALAVILSASCFKPRKWRQLFDKSADFIEEKADD